MSNVLNLALKKDVFESLQNGVTNEIIIDGSRWWKKRLMDLDTGKFKDFTIACVSSGSSDKVEYEIKSIEQRGRDFVVTVYVAAPENTPVTPDEGEQPCVDNGDSDSDFDNEPIQYSDGAVPPIQTITEGSGEGIEITGIKGTVEDLVNPEVIKPVKINPVTVDVDENGVVIVKQTYAKPISEITQRILLKKDGAEILPDGPEGEEEKPLDDPEDNFSNNVKDVKEVIWNLFNKFCELNDVYVVNMPNVTIRNNGQIFGCKKRLIADRDSDVKFNFNKEVFVKYDNMTDSAFALQILAYLNNLLKNNYVFVNKNACVFRKNELGNLVFVISAIGKRKYLFAK